MGYRDLQEFIAALEQAGELHRIKVQVSLELATQIGRASCRERV